MKLYFCLFYQLFRSLAWLPQCIRLCQINVSHTPFIIYQKQSYLLNISGQLPIKLLFKDKTSIVNGWNGKVGHKPVKRMPAKQEHMIQKHCLTNCIETTSLWKWGVGSQPPPSVINYHSQSTSKANDEVLAPHVASLGNWHKQISIVKKPSNPTNTRREYKGLMHSVMEQNRVKRKTTNNSAFVGLTVIRFYSSNLDW